MAWLKSRDSGDSTAECPEQPPPAQRADVSTRLLLSALMSLYTKVCTRTPGSLGPAKQTLKRQAGTGQDGVGAGELAKRGIVLHIPTEKEVLKDIKRPAKTQHFLDSHLHT